MILETTLQEDETLQHINQKVGNSYSFWQRLKMGGIGSKRMMVEKASTHFDDYLSMNEDLTYVNIELRPKGILLHFNKRLRQFVWAIPYADLQVVTQPEFRIEAKEVFLQFEKNRYLIQNKEFIERLMALKEEGLLG